MTAPKAVFDTVSYLQAVTNPNGPAWAALELTDVGRIRLVASEETLREVVDVLSRPNTRGRNYLTRNIHHGGRASSICVWTAFRSPWLWEAGEPPSSRGTRFQSCPGSIHRSLR